MLYTQWAWDGGDHSVMRYFAFKRTHKVDGMRQWEMKSITSRARKTNGFLRSTRDA